ncbi:sensor histidine kinase [Nonomuraea thailandensis]
MALRLPDGEPAWPSEVAGTVYRLVQESLTNVSRHAPGASAVTVSVTQATEELVVEVTDDAPPSHRTHRDRLGGGYGLVGMRERVEALGGTLSAGPRPAGGWTVHATLPLPERDAHRTPAASGGRRPGPAGRGGGEHHGAAGRRPAHDPRLPAPHPGGPARHPRDRRGR